MASALIDEIKLNASNGDSEQYDLAGFTPGWLHDLVGSCLGTTLPAKSYVACKFVIGGGKKTRAKYDPDMLKHFTEALRAAGLEEDRGASACAECAGTYKYQHDTDKDLKYLHVFPKVEIVSAGGDGDGVNGGGDRTGGGNARSPEYQCCSCTFEEFIDLVAMNVPSFSQKRALLKRMRVLQSALEQLENMLVEQQRLTEQEQEMYDSMVDVSSKVDHLNAELEKMVSKGRLTKGEQKAMIGDLASKLEELDVMIATVDAEGKQKKRETLEGKRVQLIEKSDAIASFKPIVYAMANERELNDLRAELKALEALEKASGGKLLKGADVAKLAKKPQIEERIAALEGEDKGWFEDECRAVLFTQKAPAPAKKKAASGGGGGGGNSSGWLTQAAKGGGRSAPAAKKTAPSNPFAALGGDE